jgi:predicted Zn-dependent peptidase
VTVAPVAPRSEPSGGGPVKTVLPSGIRVVTERVPGATSVTIGFWVGVGSRDERPDQAGVSHFLEHLLFKGTEARSARQIAVTVDSVGGEMNAFTAREHTAFYARLPAERVDLGLELLTDVVSAPAFRPHEIEAEREVILEEILMNEDIPEDVVMTRLYEAVFPEHALGRETLGREETIEAMTRDAIAGFHAAWYRPANLVVAVAGDVTHDHVVQAVEGFLADGPGGEPPTRRRPTAEPTPLVVVERPTEQVHIAMGWRGVPAGDDDRYALHAANHVLGGGMSSRLFQEVREERGLAYTVYSAPSGYADTGSLVLYAGTAPARVTEVLDVLDEVLVGLLEHGVTDAELGVALGYLEGSLLLGLEDSASRMMRLGVAEITRGEVPTVDEHVARLRAVTPDDVHRVVRRVLEAPRAMAVVGPLTPDDPRLG